MHSKALSISVIFLAVLGLHGAPIQDQHDSLFARGNKVPAHNAHTPDEAPTAGAAYVLHQKRSRLWRRAPPEPMKGKTLKLTSDGGHEAHVTVGSRIGAGMSGTVHHVTSHNIPGDHPSLVVKTLHATATEKDKANFHGEIERLGPNHVNQLAFAGKDDKGNMHAVMHRVPGEHLHDTAAWKAAPDRKSKDALIDHARGLTSAAALHHVDKHGLLHTDLHHDNVKFTEKDGKLHQAHLLDWGGSKKVPAGSLTEEQKKAKIAFGIKGFVA